MLYKLNKRDEIQYIGYKREGLNGFQAFLALNQIVVKKQVDQIS